MISILRSEENFYLQKLENHVMKNSVQVYATVGCGLNYNFHGTVSAIPRAKTRLYFRRATGRSYAVRRRHSGRPPSLWNYFVSTFDHYHPFVLGLPHAIRAFMHPHTPWYLLGASVTIRIRLGWEFTYAQGDIVLALQFTIAVFMRVYFYSRSLHSLLFIINRWSKIKFATIAYYKQCLRYSGIFLLSGNRHEAKLRDNRTVKGSVQAVLGNDKDGASISEPLVCDYLITRS